MQVPSNSLSQSRWNNVTYLARDFYLRTRQHLMGKGTPLKRTRLDFMEHLGQAEKPWLSGLEGFEGGNADNFEFYISELVLKSGVTVPINRIGVTAIVGGNNVGKSTMLREIYGRIHGEPAHPMVSSLVLDSVHRVWGGNAADMIDWLVESYGYTRSVGNAHMGFLAPGHSGAGRVPPRDLVIYRNGDDGKPIGSLAPFLCHLAAAMERFAHVQPVDRRLDIEEGPTNALHYMEDNADTFQEFLAAARDIFGIELTLDPLSGQMFFRVGKPSTPAPPVDNLSSSPEYLQQIRNLPKLQNQGDGIQSALALLIPLITASFPLILVDEPEAFLHPPQARKLGAILARIAQSREVQLVVATHDRHFLTGLLDADDVDVSVLRLSRTGDATQVTHLEAEVLRQAWSTALLRHSNLLDGLFHRLVVIAENERDCRFYAAALESMDLTQELPIRPHDVQFVSSSGKGNIASLVNVLRSSGVPVIASPDLDIVNDEQTLAKLYAQFGGDWSLLKPLYLAATAEFRTSRTPRKNADVLRDIQRVLNENPEANYTGQTKSDVARALRVENDWQRLKDFGVQAFLRERVKAVELMERLADVGIVPVHVGELEKFAPELNLGKGDAWLEGALAAKAHERTEVREHITRILNAAKLSSD